MRTRPLPLLVVLSSLSAACAPAPPEGGETESTEDGGGSSTGDGAESDASGSASTAATSGDGDSTSGDGDGTGGDGDATSGDGDSTSGDGDSTTGDGDGDGCTIGEIGCACFANDTCFEPGVCENGVCACEAGTLGCPCFPNATCFAPLSCDPALGLCGGGGGGLVDCGPGLQCPVGPDAACCWDTYLSEGPPQGECVQGTPDNDGCATQENASGHETRIECQGAQTCAQGQRCCGELYDSPFGQNYMNTACADVCLSFQVCTTDGECPLGEVCNPSNYLPSGYGFCA